MRKTAFYLILMLISGNMIASASEDGRTEHGVFARKGIVIGRGVLNVVGTPFELIRTPIAEVEKHKWAWPITSIPRSVTNVLIRGTSAVNDIVVYPWVVPFSNDISPITEPYGLPKYVWSRA